MTIAPEKMNEDFEGDGEESSVPALALAPGMMRFAAIIEYDGTEFCGLQWQDNGPTIQGAFEKMARQFGVEDCRFRASGRTDSGVHARGQVITVDLPEKLNNANLIGAMNWHLPESIRVRRTVVAPLDFDPRRDARMRTYRYLLCGGQPMPPLMRHRMGRVKAHLDLEKMRTAAKVFRGTHDFAAWRSTQCQARRTVLDLRRMDIVPWAESAPHNNDTQCFEIVIACRSFLHRMVRYLVGGLVCAGNGLLTPESLQHHLEAGTLPPHVAPVDACGLSLERVEYESDTDPFLK